MNGSETLKYKVTQYKKSTFVLIVKTVITIRAVVTMNIDCSGSWFGLWFYLFFTA